MVSEKKGGYMKAQDFLETILGDGAGYATIVTKDARGIPTIQKFFSYPDEIEEMAEYAIEHKNEDVYFSPIVYYEQRRIRENAKSVSVVYADADTCNPANFRITPSIIVETSKDRWHAYWVLTAPYEPQRVAMLAKQVAYAHRDQGCDVSGWNPTKLLRVPETSNLKYGAGQPVTAKTNGTVYTIEEIEEAYSDVTVDKVLDIVAVPLPENIPAVMTALAKVSSNTEVLSLYIDVPTPNADLSRMLWKLEMELFRQGLTDEEVFVICKHAKCNKYHSTSRAPRADADGDLWREIQRAKQSVGNPSRGSDIIEFDELPEEDISKIDFLSVDERQIVEQNPTFVDKYVSWAQKKTDGAVEYQIAGAFTVLSAAFSEIGCAAPKYGKMGLNLWFMLLGETTRSRKSTSRSLMLRMIGAYEKFAGYQIDIGSNATGEALVKHLSSRDKLTSMFHRDEAQGLFREFVTKTYMAAAADQYTELYDGKVPVMLRSTGASSGVKAVQTERAETNFIMYLMGITSKVAEILTVDYFRSGFLARFIYVVADAPERSRESEDLEQATEYDTFVRDEEMEALIYSVYQSSLWWQKKGGVFPRPIFLTESALDRFNAFKWEMGNFTTGHSNEESIEPSRQRLALSVWKCAVLLALYDRCEEVTDTHMLIAIHYAENWFTNLVRMAGAISASEWQRDVDNLEAVIAQKGGRMRYEEAYKKFSNKRKREFDEMLQALQSQARLKTFTENNKIFLELI
jgi:hypothetical protein